MRKIDLIKTNFERAAKTINFEKIVLDRLEKKAAEERTTVSNMVNSFCRQVILNDVEYYREMAREYNMKFANAQYMKEQAELKNNIAFAQRR